MKVDEIMEEISALEALLYVNGTNPSWSDKKLLKYIKRKKELEELLKSRS